ncbi:MAG: TetR/AcrR family transcriptional regulator [Chloroflexota bacterium]
MVAAAALMFRSRGYDATSMNAIGAEAGISGPSIYYYFPSKTELLFECLFEPMRRQVEECRSASVGRTPDEAVAAFVRTIVTFVLDVLITQRMHGDTYVSMGVLAKSLPDEQRHLLLSLIHNHVRDLRDIIAAGTAEGVFRAVDPTPAAFAVMAIAENVTWFRPDGRLSKDALADLYAGFAVDMLRLQA